MSVGEAVTVPRQPRLGVWGLGPALGPRVGRDYVDAVAVDCPRVDAAAEAGTGAGPGRAAAAAGSAPEAAAAPVPVWRVDDEVRAARDTGGTPRGPRMTSAAGPMTPESLSTDCSLVDDLDLDLWEGQFEFVGPGYSSKDDDSVITPAMVRRARADRIHSTIEEDAQQWCDHLNDQVQMLQQQVGVLADNQTSTDERYTRAKQDNAALQARVLMLEEQLRETELRADERLQDEQKRHRELMVRVEREKQLELENCAIRLQTMELEASTMREEITRLRQHSDQLRAEKLRTQEALIDSEGTLAVLRDELGKQKDGFRQREAEHQQREQLVEELSMEIERLREAAQRLAVRDRDPDRDQGAQVLALGAQLERVREEARSLREANEELQALVLTRGVEEGRSLLTGGSSSLAAELEAMSQDENMDKSLDQSSVAKIRQALKEQQEMNSQLRQYIDGILINIIENYPELLEVRKP
ncbi:hypothetical protein ONE63_005969 [Megalurothrips usitatus]|uniref:FIP-RBD domain-containing protein n=1 Tax=Megalurothrips usitatus TaxID=439358 RepID=A0AAV7XW03_9NEOP|nr:hypothetical protein ONE63_005969 [Megalurothrips usitatus]